MGLLFAPVAQGTSVLSVSLDEMVNNSEFVFEGRVVSVGSRMSQNNQRIHTYVVFDISEIIKGEYTGQQIELSFAGGTVNGMTQVVGGMHLPEVGEHGIYFVESLSRAQVHPFFGWSQGHLLINQDAAGVERVTTQRKRAVTAVAPGVRRSQQRLSNGVAEGLVLRKDNADYEGMTKSEFVRTLRDMLRQPP